MIQAEHFKSIKSKRSPSRWASVIIHKLIMIAWDIWSFRNELVHGPKGLEEQDAHKRLNEKLEKEYSKGSGNLLPEDKFLVDNNGLDELMMGTIHDKQAWLDRLDAARIAAESSEILLNDTSQRQMTDYFGSICLQHE